MRELQLGRVVQDTLDTDMVTLSVSVTAHTPPRLQVDRFPFDQLIDGDIRVLWAADCLNAAGWPAFTWQYGPAGWQQVSLANMHLPVWFMDGLRLVIPQLLPDGEECLLYVRFIGRLC